MKSVASAWWGLLLLVSVAIQTGPAHAQTNQKIKSISGDLFVYEDEEEIEVLSSRLYQRLRDVASNANSDIIFDNGAGVEIGARGYFTIWTQVPGVRGADWDLLPDGRSYWLKTVVSLDGVLENNSGNRMVVARVATTLWQVTAGLQTSLGTSAALVRVGTVKIQGGAEQDKIDQGFELFSRVDVEAIGLSWAHGAVLTENLTAYAQQSVTLGMRVLEANQGAFRAVFGSDSRLGLLIGKQFFIMGKVSLQTDYVSASQATYGVEAGWRLSDLLTLRAGGGFTKELGQTPYDEMYVVPRGWNFHVGLHAKF